MLSVSLRCWLEITSWKPKLSKLLSSWIIDQQWPLWPQNFCFIQLLITQLQTKKRKDYLIVSETCTLLVFDMTSKESKENYYQNLPKIYAFSVMSYLQRWNTADDGTHTPKKHQWARPKQVSLATVYNKTR